MSQTSPESQLKEALAALGELKSLAEGFKAQTEAKAQTEERISKAEAAIEDFKALLASVGEKVDTLAAQNKGPEKPKTVGPAPEYAEEPVDANQIGGVNKTIVKTKKKKQPLAAEGEEDMEDEEEDEEKMSKKGRGNCGKDKGPRAAEAEEEEDMEDEEEETEAKGKKAKKAGIPPQFLKNIKKKKEEMEDDESEPKAEEAEEDMEDEEEEEMSKKSKKAKKAAEPMEDEEEEDEEETEKMSKKKGKKASEEVVTPSAETNEEEAPKAEEATVEAKAEEVSAPLAEAAPAVSAPTVQETPAPKAEAVPAAVSEIEALKAKIASEAKAREDALAQVTKMQADFQNLSDLIAKYEASQKTAEEKVAKTVAQMGVEPVASSPAAEAEAVQTPEDIMKEYSSIKDAKAAREFYLKHEETIRSAAFGIKRRNA